VASDHGTHTGDEECVRSQGKTWRTLLKGAAWVLTSVHIGIGLCALATHTTVATTFRDKFPGPNSLAGGTGFYSVYHEQQLLYSQTTVYNFDTMRVINESTESTVERVNWIRTTTDLYPFGTEPPNQWSRRDAQVWTVYQAGWPLRSFIGLMRYDRVGGKSTKATFDGVTMIPIGKGLLLVYQTRLLELTVNGVVWGVPSTVALYWASKRFFRWRRHKAAAEV